MLEPRSRSHTLNQSSRGHGRPRNRRSSMGMTALHVSILLSLSPDALRQFSSIIILERPTKTAIVLIPSSDGERWIVAFDGWRREFSARCRLERWLTSRYLVHWLTPDA